MQEVASQAPRRLLTARQVQRMLEVDRSTIYRMAEDGRLPGFKVGRQWRFPEDRIVSMLDPPVPGPRPAPGASRTACTDGTGSGVGDAPAVAGPAREVAVEGLSVAALPVLEVSAELLGVMMVLADMDGRPVTEVVNPCEWFAERADDPETIATCTAEWRSLAEDLDCVPHFHTGAHGFQCARALVRSRSTLIGMVLAGGVAPPGRPASGLYHLDDAERMRVLLALPKIAAVLSRVLVRVVVPPVPKEYS